MLNGLCCLQFKFAENPKTRKRAIEGYEARLAVNVPLLDRTLEIRRRIGSLLGYKTWYNNLFFFREARN